MDAREKEYVLMHAEPCPHCGEKPDARWSGLGWLIVCTCFHDGATDDQAD